jgi:hypothetical protein
MMTQPCMTLTEENTRSLRHNVKENLYNDSVEQSNKKQTNSVALVRKRTIPTERPPLVGEVSANFSG